MAQNSLPYKVILLGESAVGKSSILTRFLKDKFDEITISTVNEFYSEKEIEIRGSPIKLQIWDTAGQEKFRSIVKNYYIDSVAAILVYDITNRETFESVQTYWYDEIINYIPNISMYISILIKWFINIVLGIAANKFDLFEKEQQVTENEGKQFAEKIGAVFSSTSAKDNIGIDALFKGIGEKIYELNNQDATFDAGLDKTKLSNDSGNVKKKKCCKSK